MVLVDLADQQWPSLFRQFLQYVNIFNLELVPWGSVQCISPLGLMSFGLMCVWFRFLFRFAFCLLSKCFQCFHNLNAKWIDFYWRLLVAVFAPLGLMLLLFLAMFVPTWIGDHFDLSDQETDRQKRQLIRAKTIRLLLFTLFLIYPGPLPSQHNFLFIIFF